MRKIARPSFSGICSTEIVPISITCRINRNYLFHVLRTDEFVDLATSLFLGANLPRLSPSLLLKFEIPLPSLEVQEKIVNILDQADDLRRKRRNALATLNRLIPTILLDTFGDLTTSQRALPTLSLGDLISVGPTNGIYNAC